MTRVPKDELKGGFTVIVVDPGAVDKVPDPVAVTVCVEAIAAELAKITSISAVRTLCSVFVLKASFGLERSVRELFAAVRIRVSKCAGLSKCKGISSQCETVALEQVPYNCPN